MVVCDITKCQLSLVLLLYKSVQPTVVTFAIACISVNMHVFFTMPTWLISTEPAEAKIH